MTIIDLQPVATPRIHVQPVAAQPEIVNDVWQLERDTCSPSKGWIGTHLLTGWQGAFATRANAKRYFERPMAEQMANLRTSSEGMIRRDYTLPEDKYRAYQVLAILNGAPILASTPGVTVLPYTFANEAVYRCYCGGYLTEDRRTHVHACEVCYSIDGPTFPRRIGDGALRPLICENEDWHKVCLRPAATHCRHATCVAVAKPEVKCEHGKEHSCGGHEC